MASKTLVFVLIFCFAHQMVEGGLQGDITQKLMKFKNIIKDVVEKALVKVENVMESTINVGVELKANFVVVLQTSADESVRTISSMVEDAVAEGKEASHCLRKVTVEQVDSVQAEMSTCVERNIAECRGYFKTSIERVRDFLKLSDKFETEVKNCGRGILSLGCLGLVGVKITSEGGLVGTKIAHMIESIVSYGVVFKDRFISCQSISAAAAGMEFTKYIADAGLCIDKCAKANVEIVIN